MKKIFSFITVAVLTFTTSCSQTGQAENNIDTDATIDIDAQGPIIKFEEKDYNYGTIHKGSDGNHEFVFINEGTEPLVLSNVRTSCGCTVPSWPKEPIPSGEKSAIKVRYDTRRLGSFNKSITVYSNGSEESIRLTIKGNVINPETAAEK